MEIQCYRNIIKTKYSEDVLLNLYMDNIPMYNFSGFLKTNSKAMLVCGVIFS